MIDEQMIISIWEYRKVERLNPLSFSDKSYIDHHYLRFTGCANSWTPQPYSTGDEKMGIANFSVTPA